MIDIYVKLILRGALSINDVPLSVRADVGRDMIPVYCTLIIKGAYTFAQVPASSKPAVEAMLLVLGYDANGVPITE